MTRWQAFTVICDYLRAGLLGGKPPKPAGGISWELLIEISSFHSVTPALAWCLKEHEEVPSEIREYFDAVLVLNSQRNESLLEGLARTVGALNAIDIEPVLLKGAAHLVEGIYPESMLRILGDLDILIPAERSADAVAALQTMGFGAKPDGVIPPPSHHHLQMLHDPQTGAGLELHTGVFGGGPHEAGFSTAWFCENTRPVRFRSRQIRLPDATRSVGHNIVHSQFFHGLYWLKRVELRHLLDLAVIRAKHESAIDWTELDHRFCSAGLGEGLATYLNIAKSLFGQPAPRLSCGPRRGGITDLRRAESRDHFQDKVERLMGTCDTLVTGLSRMTESRDHFQGTCDTLVTELSRMTESRDHFQAEAERLRASRDETLAELGCVMRSRSWRLTRPLRALATASRRWSKSWSRR